MSIEVLFSYDWAIRAILASGMVGILCGALGCFIVLRNMALIGDALSHAILPGVVFSFIIAGYSIIGFFLGSVLFGLTAAVIITWIQQNVQTKNDAAIGIIYTAMFSIGVMSISWISRNEGVHLDLKDFLFGNVLGVSDGDLTMTAAVTVFVIISIIVFYRQLFVTTFQPTIADTFGISAKSLHYFLMLLLSFSVVASLQTVGVILVVAMLITPPSTAILWSNRLQHVILISSFIGFLSATGGFFASVYFETTPGPAMAVMSTLFYGISVAIAPEKGLISKSLQKRQQKLKILEEDVLKQVYRLEQGDAVMLSKVRGLLKISKQTISRLIRRLERKSLVKLKANNSVMLTSSGIAQASELVRAHRLWETYLVKTIGLSEGQIHEEAEQLEHILTEEIMDELDETLGFPSTDPHGSPIPKKVGSAKFSLLQLEVGSKGLISHHQRAEVASKLWEQGILPGRSITISSKQNDFMHINDGESAHKISSKLAGMIQVEAFKD